MQLPRALLGTGNPGRISEARPDAAARDNSPTTGYSFLDGTKIAGYH